MNVSIYCATIKGLKGEIINVEVDINKGMPNFNIVGLPGNSVKESRERVRSAIINSGYKFPAGRITVNLSPADMKKEGSLLDISIAVGILYCSNQIIVKNINDYLFIGELSLSGMVKGVRGALAAVLKGNAENINKVIIGNENKEEAALVRETEVYGFSSLKEIIHFLEYEDLMPYKKDLSIKMNKYPYDFSDVVAQESAIRAMEIAAAGNHNIGLYGEAGCGKTMISKRMPTILPPLSYEEIIEITNTYSISGLLKENELITTRPFRNPHHSIPPASLLGGGQKLMPGEITLANNGVLFLDEILEYDRKTLDMLREPLEEKEVQLSRVSGKVTYPCNSIVIVAFNNCPCAKRIDLCSCSLKDKKRYLSKLSGALAERIDLFVGLRAVEPSILIKKTMGRTSKDILSSVMKARGIQKHRFSRESIETNSEMKEYHIKKYCHLDDTGKKLMKQQIEMYNLSARSYYRILKIARTIADINGSKEINTKELMEATNYRINFI